jgi:hypothetical protein
MKLTKILFGLGLLGLAIWSVYSLVYGYGEGVMFAVVFGGMHDESMALFRKGIARKMQLVAWDQSVMSKLMGFVGGRKNMFEATTNFASSGFKPSATGAPIEVYQDFRNGGSEMEIPAFYPLTSYGKIGSETLKGTGEKAKLALQKVKINQLRHAYLLQDNKMSKQVWTEKKIVQQLYENAEPYLTDWFGRRLPMEVYFALLESYATHMTDSTHGVGCQKRSHMNFYTAGAGRVAFSTVHATYESNVATALNNVGSGDIFNTQFIRNLVYEASHTHKIMPTKLNGIDVYPVFISDSQARDLGEDRAWIDRNSNAGVRDALNPVFTGKLLDVYESAALIVDKTIPSVRTASSDGSADYSNARSTTGDASGVCYSTEDANGKYDFMENTVDDGKLKPAILIGKSAVLCGVANDIDFDEETDDFNQRKEIGADMMIGLAAADIFDEDGSFGKSGNKRHENRSSLVGVTYTSGSANWSAA